MRGDESNANSPSFERVVAEMVGTIRTRVNYFMFMIRGSAPLACGQVVCLFCGHRTPALAVVSSISLVRCRVCGKEAPYLAGEIVTFQPLAEIA
jgi:hypothetical protein